MHPELVLISNLYNVDKQQDALRHEHEALVAAVTAGQKRLSEAKAALVTAEAELAAARSADRANTVELDGYLQKRDNTRRLIDGGTASNYDAAVKQLENCVRIVDELETKALELMERLDKATTAARYAREDAERAEELLTAARAALSQRDAPLRAELTAVLSDREGHWAALPPDLRSPYQDLRRRKRPVLVNTNNGCCASCFVKVPQQRIIETQLKRGIFTCPGCSGWLLPG